MFRSSSALLVAFAGCTAFDPEPIWSHGSGDHEPAIPDIVGLPSPDDPTPRGIYMIIPDPPASSAAADQSYAPAGYLLYLNRDGGTYIPGANDSSTNRSSVPNNTSTIPPWNVPDGDAGWQQVVSCVRELFRPFDIEVTDVNPGATAHVECVIAGSPGDVGLPSNVGGVSPFTKSCSVIPRSIVYTFAEIYGSRYRSICEVAAQEIAHSFGLDHEYLCPDPMTYLSRDPTSNQPCGDKFFQDLAARCGENQERDCNCPVDPSNPSRGNFPTQNSYQKLGERIGFGDAEPPVVRIVEPPDGARLRPGFAVEVTASDNIGVTRVELYIDGQLAGTANSAPFRFTTDASVTLGPHAIETRAYDGKNVATATVSVTVDPNAAANPTNPAGSGGSTGIPDVVGGCSAMGPQAGAAPPLVLLAWAFLAFGRRRRARRGDTRAGAKKSVGNQR